MKTFFKNYQNEAQQAVPMNSRLSLTRAFVETGDERCPLAGIWSRLPEMDAALDDEPGLTRLAEECSYPERFFGELIRFSSSLRHKHPIA